MVDLDAPEAAGLANAQERAALIACLDSLGFSADEIVNAERDERQLFQLGGDAVRRRTADLQPADRCTCPAEG
jgi:adenylate cyclase